MRIERGVRLGVEQTSAGQSIRQKLGFELYTTLLDQEVKMTATKTSDTAPQDGSNFLAFVNGIWTTVYWELYDEGLQFETGMRGNWMFSDPILYKEYGQADFKYWMDYPDSPQAD